MKYGHAQVTDAERCDTWTTGIAPYNMEEEV
jgi:hypothetical protein